MKLCLLSIILTVNEDISTCTCVFAYLVINSLVLEYEQLLDRVNSTRKEDKNKLKVHKEKFRIVIEDIDKEVQYNIVHMDCTPYTVSYMHAFMGVIKSQLHCPLVQRVNNFVSLFISCLQLCTRVCEQYPVCVCV